MAIHSIAPPLLQHASVPCMPVGHVNLQNVVDTTIEQLKANDSQVKKRLADYEKEAEKRTAMCHAYFAKMAAKLLQDELTEDDFTLGMSLFQQVSDCNKQSLQTSIECIQENNRDNEQILDIAQAIITNPNESIAEPQIVFLEKTANMRQEREASQTMHELELLQAKRCLEQKLLQRNHWGSISYYSR